MSYFQFLGLTLLLCTTSPLSASSDDLAPEIDSIEMFETGCMFGQIDYFSTDLKPFLNGATPADEVTTSGIDLGPNLYGKAWRFGHNAVFAGIPGGLFVSASPDGVLWGHCRLLFGWPVDTAKLPSIFEDRHEWAVLLDRSEHDAVTLLTYGLGLPRQKVLVEFMLSGGEEPVAILTLTQPIGRANP